METQTQSTVLQEHPSLLTTSLIVVSVIFPLLSLASILLRLRFRALSRKPLHADDWWVLGTYVLTLGLSINAWTFAPIVGIDYMRDPIGGIQKSLKCIFVSSCLLQPPLATVKISILLFYKRVFNIRKFSICIWTSVVFMGCWGILFLVLLLCEADPIAKNWGAVGRFLYDPIAVGTAQVGSSIAFDFVVLCFPLPVISRLHLQRKTKAAMSLIFWLGAFCCVAAIVRLVFLRQSINEVAATPDHVHLQANNYIFMILEPNCSIIAACLPTYGPLFRGGRSQMSLVRSARTLFSLRSLSSNTEQYNDANDGGGE